MNYPYLLLAALPLATPALAQPAPKPVQIIALDDHSTVVGVLALPNHNTVLLLGCSTRPELVAHCLTPDGRTAWKTTLARYQHSSGGSAYLLDTRDIAIGRAARDRKQTAREVELAGLWPLEASTDGNDVVLAETLSKSSAKDLTKKGTPLEEGQVLVQRLDADGHLTKKLFAAPPAPESRRLEVRQLGCFADAAGYVEVLREVNAREEITTYYLQHYDLASGRVRREPVTLPATPKHLSGMAMRHWYQDWSYLGHRPGQTYFSRRVFEASGEAKAKELPCNFEVRLVDDQGRPATPAGFRTTLELSQGTRAGYSGYVAAPGEADHVPALYSMPQGKGYITVDEYNISSGGTGALSLDYATGDVLIVGEYVTADSPMDGGLKVDGLFARRYTADGRLLAASQQAYTEEMRDFGGKADFKGGLYRNARLHVDPVSGQPRFHTYLDRDNQAHEGYCYYFGPNLALQRYDHPHKAEKGDQKLTYVYTAQPTCHTSTIGAGADVRLYEHAAPTDPPLYAMLEKLRRAGRPDEEAEYYRFYLSPTAPGKALVIQRPDGIGGTLSVYAP